MEFIYNGQEKLSGIYKISNKLNNRLYIGSTKEFKVRWQAHASSLRKCRHSNKFLQADFNKYGSDAFIFEILEVTAINKKERLPIEDLYISAYYGVGCFNLRKTATTSEGHVFREHEQHFAAKKFRLLSPEGEIYSGTNITKFCEEHDLCKENITAVLSQLPNDKSVRLVIR